MTSSSQLAMFNSQFSMNYQLPITNVAKNGQSKMANVWLMANGKWSNEVTGGNV